MSQIYVHAELWNFTAPWGLEPNIFRNDAPFPGKERQKKNISDVTMFLYLDALHCPYQASPLVYVPVTDSVATAVPPRILATWQAGTPSVFFVREKKVCVKRVFGFFLSFFTHKKWFSRTNFIQISRTVRPFHGHFVKNFHVWAIFCFTSWNRYFAVLCVKFFRKLWFSEKFHAQNSFFTGTFYDFFTDRFAFSRRKNRFFSRTSVTFSRKKNTVCGWCKTSQRQWNVL